MSKKPNRLSPEVRECAVPMVQERPGEYPFLWAAVESIQGCENFGKQLERSGHGKAATEGQQIRKIHDPIGVHIGADDREMNIQWAMEDGQ